MLGLGIEEEYCDNKYNAYDCLDTLCSAIAPRLLKLLSNCRSACFQCPIPSTYTRATKQEGSEFTIRQRYYLAPSLPVCKLMVGDFSIKALCKKMVLESVKEGD